MERRERLGSPIALGLWVPRAFPSPSGSIGRQYTRGGSSYRLQIQSNGNHQSVTMPAVANTARTAIASSFSMEHFICASGLGIISSTTGHQAPAR